MALNGPNRREETPMSDLDTRTQRTDPWWATTPPADPAASAAYPPVVAVRERRRIGDLLVVGLLSAGLASGGTYAVTRTVAVPVAATPSANASAASASPAPAPVAQADGTAPDRKSVV